MGIAIEQLRYVNPGCRDPQAAADFATGVLGLQPVPLPGVRAFRSDARAYTLVYAAGQPRPSIGLEVRDIATLARAAEALQAFGLEARRDDALAAARQVKALLGFTTPGGLDVELVVRPQDCGWRFFPSTDSGVTGLAAVALRTPEIARDEALWTGVFGMRVNDWIGDAAYLGLSDGVHHRLALHPADAAGVLAIEYAVESLDKVMQRFYALHDAGEAPLHGPGRRPTSEQVFLTFAGPDAVAYSLVAEGRVIGPDSRPRQFAPRPDAYCGWGSACRIAEFAGRDGTRARPRLREVGGA
ncbi:hypothetical protein LDO26_16715 [Luteimonas sp. BDR2-5]|uniref:hypothetical protein n=1 Tax=Proluteimonas luteida TaxID=2878685 RepID=UPI001E31BFE0|nr:hypothetical protein [Luteimonas sp. BDR2-5]MCD9029835.1 hypothetical protein [Luteimonas sp. BDR2-5]